MNHGDLSFMSLLVRMLLALVVFAPLVWIVTVWVAKRATITGSKRSMRVVEALALGAQKKLVLVEVAGRLLVLGVSQRDVRLLAEFSHQEWEAEQGNIRLGRIREEASD